MHMHSDIILLLLIEVLVDFISGYIGMHALIMICRQGVMEWLLWH